MGSCLNNPIRRRLCGSWAKAFFLLLTLFLSALFWAKARDPFHREWLSLKTADGARFSAVVVMPDRGGPFPVVVWCHGAGGSAEGSGKTLRQFASLGLASVGFEFDQTNQAGFDAQFEAVLAAVEKKWATTKHTEHTKAVTDGFQFSTANPPAGTSLNEGVSANRKSEIVNHKLALAWVGHSLGAQRQLSFLVRHPEWRPVALVRLNGGLVEEVRVKAESEKREGGNGGSLTTNHTERTKVGTEGLHSPAKHFSADVPPPNPQPASFNLQPATGLALRAWLAHGENDEVFPAADARAVAAALRAMGADVRMDIFPGRGHNFGEDQCLLVRRAAEFCARELGATRIVPDNVRSAHEVYWLPVVLLGLVRCLGGGRAGRWWRSWRASAGWLRGSAVGVAVLAGLASALHLLLPLCRADDLTIRVARSRCVRPEQRADFDWLMRQPGMAQHRLRDALEHLQLATIQRDRFSAGISEREWREYVLSPLIAGTEEDIAWRRELWETFAPRVRRETELMAAVEIVMRELRLRVLPVRGVSETGPPSEVWRRGQGDATGYERLAVAALRATGVPARLNQDGAGEVLAQGRWQTLPRPQI